MQELHIRSQPQPCLCSRCGETASQQLRESLTLIARWRCVGNRATSYRHPQTRNCRSPWLASPPLRIALEDHGRVIQSDGRETCSLGELHVASRGSEVHMHKHFQFRCAQSMVQCSGMEKEHKPKLLSPIFSGGVRVFHVKGWGPKSSVCPLKPGKSNFLGGISQDFAGISRRRPKSLNEQKKFVFNFVA